MLMSFQSHAKKYGPFSGEEIASATQNVGWMFWPSPHTSALILGEALSFKFGPLWKLIILN